VCKNTVFKGFFKQFVNQSLTGCKVEVNKARFFGKGALPDASLYHNSKQTQTTFK